MRISKLCFAILFCLITSTAFGELTMDEVRRLQKELAPAADAAWRTIPWKIDLLEAQRLAAEQRKPIFIWAMDGHPLGCT